jgi:isocitrate lyase
MLAYVELVQRKEKEIGCDVLTHQKWFVSFAKLCSRCVANFYDTGAVPTTLIR